MKYLKKFNEDKESEPLWCIIDNTDFELIEDLFQEYLDKYNFIDRDEFESRNDRYHLIDDRNIYKIEKASATLFKKPGVTDGKSGVLITIKLKVSLLSDDTPDKKFVNDMELYINRISKLGFKVDTSRSFSTLYIFVYKN